MFDSGRYYKSFFSRTSTLQDLNIVKDNGDEYLILTESLGHPVYMFYAPRIMDSTICFKNRNARERSRRSCDFSVEIRISSSALLKYYSCNTLEKYLARERSSFPDCPICCGYTLPLSFLFPLDPSTKLP